MNREVKEIWLKALRSGDYKQARKSLEVTQEQIDRNLWGFSDQTPGYCCLGVLANEAVKATADSENPILRRIDNDGEAYYGTQEEFDNHTECEGLLPDSVKDWAGLVHTNVYFNSPFNFGTTITASDLNDEHGFSFMEIAELIEEQL
jgi:hypothetical protein